MIFPNNHIFFDLRAQSQRQSSFPRWERRRIMEQGTWDRLRAAKPYNPFSLCGLQCITLTVLTCRSHFKDGSQMKWGEVMYLYVVVEPVIIANPRIGRHGLRFSSYTKPGRHEFCNLLLQKLLSRLFSSPKIFHTLIPRRGRRAEDHPTFSSRLTGSLNNTSAPAPVTWIQPEGQLKIYPSRLSV